MKINKEVNDSSSSSSLYEGVTLEWFRNSVEQVRNLVAVKVTVFTGAIKRDIRLDNTTYFITGQYTTDRKNLMQINLTHWSIVMKWKDKFYKRIRKAVRRC